MHGKTYRSVKEKAPQEAVALSQAVKFLQEYRRASFDETVEVHIHLGVDASQSEQMVRGTVSLPHGTPKQKRIAVFTSNPDQQAKAKEAGASEVGGEDLVAKIEQAGTLNADVTIATPDLMPKIAKVAKILGPKGLMPNPKTGTVTPDPLQVMQALAAGKVSFKMDQTGNIHEGVAKVSWPANKIEENIQALLDAVSAVRPKGAKGKLLRSVTVKSTMSVGVPVKA
jgi:large subunit ribosomal protein L1